MDAGAILVGKTKTTQFAEGEAPVQWYELFPQFLTYSSLSHIYGLQRYSNYVDDRRSSQTLDLATVITPAKEPFES